MTSLSKNARVVLFSPDGYRTLFTEPLMDSTSAPLPRSWPAEMFPALTPAQQARVLAHGRLRNAENGETVAEPSTPGSSLWSFPAGSNFFDSQTPTKRWSPFVNLASSPASSMYFQDAAVS